MTFAKIMREKGFEPSCPERAPDPKTRARPPTREGQGCSDTLESAGIGTSQPVDVTPGVTRLPKAHLPRLGVQAVAAVLAMTEADVLAYVRPLSVIGTTLGWSPLDVRRFAEAGYPRNEQWVHPRRGPRCKTVVYVARRPDTREYKIGFASVLKTRISALQSGSAADLEVMLSFPGTVEDERDLQARFASDRIAREWFRESPRLLAWIGRQRKVTR